MKALVIDKPGSICVIEKEIPVIRSDEVLVRLKYIGFCGSDMNTYLGKNPMVQYPRIPGHEISGVIEGTGSQVPGDFTIGETVTIVPYTACGHCPSCRRGRSHACQFNQTMGVQRDGAMQEFIAVPWQKVIKAPGLNQLELTLVEPLTVGFHAIDRGRVDDSDTVMILGCGMIGAGAIIRSVLRGAQVIAVDIDNRKLDLAKELGAHHTINSRTSDLHQTLVELTAGNGPDAVIESAGKTTTFITAVDEVAYSGRIVCIGYAPKKVFFATRLVVQKELDVMGSRNATPEDFKAVISFLENRTIPLDKIITRKVKPPYADDVVKAWSKNQGKVVKILLDFT